MDNNKKNRIAIIVTFFIVIFISIFIIWLFWSENNPLLEFGDKKQTSKEDKQFTDEPSFSFGFHPSGAGAYSYANDLGVDFNREGLYFIWNWVDKNNNGHFSFKSATIPPKPDSLRSGDTVYDYDKERVKLAKEKNIQVMANVCPSRGQIFASRGQIFDYKKNEVVYQKFVEKLVERYDGDGDYGCVESAPDCYLPGDNEYPTEDTIVAMKENPIEYWQTCNQVLDVCQGKDCAQFDTYATVYAKVQEFTYKGVKSACPECSVLIGGDSHKELYPPIYKLLNGEYVDIIDKHFFGEKNEYRNIQNEMDYLKDSLKDSGFDLDDLRFWITETGTYSGDPVSDKPGVLDLPYQSESEQASGLIKIYATSFGEEIEKVLWAWGLYEGFVCDCCIFDYTGLIYDGNRETQKCDGGDIYDLGEGVEKLAYYSFKLMTNKLSGFSSVDAIKNSGDTFLYKFIVDDRPIYIAWSELDSKEIDLNILGLDKVKVTKAVADFTNGGEIKKKNVEFSDMFREYIVDKYVRLGKTPVFIEESDAEVTTVEEGNVEEWNDPAIADVLDIQEDIPYYFLAVHHEPHHVEDGPTEVFDIEYVVTERMIAKADEYNIKLTLMFNPQWAEYLTESKDRLDALEQWKDTGHEIAIHHHSIFHGNWNGYTDFPQEKILKERKSKVDIGLIKQSENYLGTLDDMLEILRTINTGINSACFNTESAEMFLPAGVIYDTCSGYANYGEPGRRINDSVTPMKGVNEYITTSVVNGEKKYWLTHYQTTKLESVRRAKEIFLTLGSNKVYGSVNHNSKREEEAFMKYLEFLHSQDPKGKMSRTLTEVIESKLIPEKEINLNEIIKKEREAVINAGNAKCGDGICDIFEQANPRVCVRDCAEDY